jgi:ribosomal protein S6--L-glutamate ligase
MSESKIIVGSEEWFAFPGLGIPAIKARVDSGAKTSAMHAFNIQPFKRGGQPWVSFEVHPLQKNRKATVRCESPVIDKRVVKSSIGVSEKRFVIREPIVVDGRTWEIDLTLTNRDSMGYRMLLGREAMSGRMLVDPDESFCLGEQSRKSIRELYQEAEHVRSGLRIGLLASNPELYSNQRILEAGDERGHDVTFLDVQECYMKLDADNPEVHYRGGRVLNNLDALITRLRPSVTSYGCALVRQFESMGVLTVNNAMSIAQSRDKLLSLQVLLQSGIKIPITAFASAPNETGDLIDMVEGAPLIVKLLEGTQGRGVVLAETRKAADSVINAFKRLNANLLVQQYIREAQGKDLRCFVIGNKVVAAIQREAAPGEFRANIHRGGSAQPVKITAEERNIAIKAAKVFGLSVAGVDIIRSSNGPLLLEVNSSPELEGVEGATGKDVAGQMLASVERQLGWKRELGVASPRPVSS